MSENNEQIFEVYIPPLFRYLEKKHVDAFFSDGDLQLSTFFKMRKHQDEQRGDPSEGHGKINYKINGQPAQTEDQVGIDSYVLCTSLLHSTQMYNDFKCDSCIEINDPLQFANLIAREIKGVERVIFGPCHYVLDKTIDRNSVSQFSCEKEHDYETLLQKTVLDGSIHVPFRKHCQYCHQHEYRFLWEISSAMEPIDGSKVIKVPEAIPLCNRLDRSSICPSLVT